MTGDDLATLLRWLHGDEAGQHWLGGGARSLMLGERALRAMLSGKRPIPQDMQEAVCIMAAARLLLKTAGPLPAAVHYHTVAAIAAWRRLLENESQSRLADRPAGENSSAGAT